jgi:hypothetical protein
LKFCYFPEFKFYNNIFCGNRFELDQPIILKNLQDQAEKYFFIAIAYFVVKNEMLRIFCSSKFFIEILLKL